MKPSLNACSLPFANSQTPWWSLHSHPPICPREWVRQPPFQSPLSPSQGSLMHRPALPRNPRQPPSQGPLSPSQGPLMHRPALPRSPRQPPFQGLSHHPRGLRCTGLLSPGTSGSHHSRAPHHSRGPRCTGLLSPDTLGAQMLPTLSLQCSQSTWSITGTCLETGEATGGHGGP